MEPRRLPLAVLALLAIAATAFAQSENAMEVTSLAMDEEAEPFAAALGAALARELSAAGFSVAPASASPASASLASSRPASPEGPSSGGRWPDEELLEAARRDSGAEWLAVARCSTERRRLVWRIAVYDARDGAMIAADSGGAFAGASALAALDERAAAVARDAAALSSRVVPDPPIGYRLSFASADEGAKLRFGSDEEPGAIVAGSAIVADGALVAPYVPFASGSPVSATLSKDGYWPLSVRFVPPPEREPVWLAPLMLKSRFGLSLGTAAGRLLGAQAEFRYFFSEDSAFARIGAAAWVQAILDPGAAPIAHAEYGVGLGSYLFLPPGSRLRVSAGAGASGIVTAVGSASLEEKTFFDLSIDALRMTVEWHWPTVAVFLEQRLSYSVGLGSGLLYRGWWDSVAGPATFSAGVLFKWP